VTDFLDALAGKTVVVTGGCGFVGSHLATALSDVTDVRVLDDLSSGDADRLPPRVRFVRGDVRDRETVDRVLASADVVFHQAGLVSVPESVRNPKQSHSVNATGTVEVLEAARRVDASVVLASSAAVYGQPEEVPIPETHPKGPESPYALDKLVLDHYARLYADRYGLQTVALRYFNVYGPDQSEAYAGVIETFRTQARAGGPLTIHGDGTQTRDFVHVDDVVQANLAAAVRGTPGRAYNVGTGTSHSINDLADLVTRLVDRDLATEHTDERAGDVDRSRADVARARAELDFQPSVPLADGLTRLLA